MKKSDLKYGNVVETREGIKYLYHCKNSDKFLNLDFDGFLWIRNFDENLKCINDLNELDIVKVYKDYTCKELLWKRKEEPKPTEDEKVILRNLPKEYKWIARDKRNTLYVYKENEPFTTGTVWNNHSDNYARFPYDDIFKSISWEDIKPTYIDDYVDRN